MKHIFLTINELNSDNAENTFKIVNELFFTKEKQINIHINSYGGEIALWNALINILKEISKHKKLIFTISGFLGSASTFILFEFDEVYIKENSEIMFHFGDLGFEMNLTEAIRNFETIKSNKNKTIKPISNLLLKRNLNNIPNLIKTLGNEILPKRELKLICKNPPKKEKQIKKLIEKLVLYHLLKGDWIIDSKTALKINLVKGIV